MCVCVYARFKTEKKMAHLKNTLYVCVCVYVSHKWCCWAAAVYTFASMTYNRLRIGSNNGVIHTHTHKNRVVAVVVVIIITIGKICKYINNTCKCMDERR